MNPNVKLASTLLAKHPGQIEAMWRQAKKHASIDGKKADYVRAFKQFLLMVKMRGASSEELPDSVNSWTLFMGKRALITDSSATFFTVHFEAEGVTLNVPLINLLFCGRLPDLDSKEA